jgi:hypothetical protein
MVKREINMGKQKNDTMEPQDMNILTSKQEVADELKMSIRVFEKLEQRYPFTITGISGRINGRWKVTRDYIQKWFAYVQRQESRHPEARRTRPEEPPELQEIKGRAE